MTDPIADMLTRIRNAQMVGKASVHVPFSSMHAEIAKVLEKKGFVKSVEKRGRKIKRTLEIEIAYADGRTPKIHGLKRVSSPGRRTYVKSSELHPIKSGRGIAVISTSKGLMTNSDAKAAGLGGEYLLEVW